MADFAVTELDSGIDFSNLPYWDVVIVGAGPAGLAASLTTAHRGLTTLVVEAKSRPGGQPQFLYADKKIVDVPGFPDGITGEELSARVFRQADDALVQFRFNEELVAIEDTDRVAKDDPLKRLVTNDGGYLCRKVIIACGLLHYPRKLPVLDQLDSKKVYYKIPKIGDYEENQVAVVGGGDSAMDAALMVLQRNGRVDMVIREEVPLGKADTLARIRRLGGNIHTSSEITEAEFRGDKIVLTLSDGNNMECDLAIVQIGFLSAKETFQRLDLRLNQDGSIAIDPYYETSRRGIFAVGTEPNCSQAQADVILAESLCAEVTRQQDRERHQCGHENGGVRLKDRRARWQNHLAVAGPATPGPCSLLELGLARRRRIFLSLEEFR